MWHRALIVALLALTGCAAVPNAEPVTANSDGSLTLHVAAKRVAECKTNGGCGLYTRAELAALANAAARYGAKTCQSGTAL